MGKLVGLMFFVACLLLIGCQSEVVDGSIVASGFIEGEEVVIAPETSGRIAEMLVDRGDDVRAGDVLVRLDDAMLRSQRLEAEAGLATANANLARVLAGARAEQIAAARAAAARVPAPATILSGALIPAGRPPRTARTP